MSRWAETFARLSGGSDTMDTMRHCAEPPPIVSHSVHSVMAAPGRLRPGSVSTVAPTALGVADAAIPAAERAAAIWGDAEAERAAIVQFEGGIPREWAEGFARLDPDHPPVDVPPGRWQRFVDDVGRFLDSPFVVVAATLGWGPYDLFGCDRDRPFALTDQAGLLWLLDGDRLVMLAEDAATIETKGGARQTWRRKPPTSGRILAWELPT